MDDMLSGSDLIQLQKYLLGLITLADFPQCSAIIPEVQQSCNFDWNNDGFLNEADLFYGSDYILGNVSTISGTSDLNQSDSFNGADVILLQQYLLGLVTLADFPQCSEIILGAIQGPIGN